MKDFVLSGYSCEDRGDLTGIEVTPTQGPVQTVQCVSLVRYSSGKFIDRLTGKLSISEVCLNLSCNAAQTLSPFRYYFSWTLWTKIFPFRAYFKIYEARGP